MIFVIAFSIAIAIAAAVIVGVVLYAHHKHLSALAEVSNILTSVRTRLGAQYRVPPAAPVSPAAPKVEQQ